MKKNRIILLSLLITALFIALSACGGNLPPPPLPEGPAVKSVDITGKPSGIQDFIKDETWQLDAVVVTEPAGEEAGFDVVWASENKETATVDQAGLVTTVAPGITRITASAGGKEDSFELCLKGELRGVELEKPAADKVFYTGESKEFMYAPVPVVTDAFTATIATTNEYAAKVELNQAHGSVIVTAGLVKGDAVITLKITKNGASGVVFTDMIEFSNVGEKPLIYDFDKNTDDMSYSAILGTASVTDAAAELPGAAVSPKALKFSSTVNGDKPGLEFDIKNSGRYGPAGNYRLSLKLKVLSHSGSEKLLIRLYDSKSDDTNRKWEAPADFTAIEDGKTVVLPPQPASNRTYDRLLMALDGTGQIEFTVTDILWERTPLTELKISNKPAGTIDLRTYVNAAADADNDNRIYRLGILPGGTDGTDYEKLMTWTASSSAVVVDAEKGTQATVTGIITVNSATGAVTIPKSVKSGTANITVTMRGTPFTDTASFTFETSDPEVEITNKNTAGGWHALGSAAVNPAGQIKTGTKVWSSSDTGVAAIDASTGEITYVGAGTSVITLSDGVSPVPGADSFVLGVYNPAVTKVFDFSGITNANAVSKGISNLSGGVTVNSTSSGLHSGSVALAGVKAEAVGKTSYPGIDVAIPMQAGKRYDIQIKIRLLAFDGTDQKIVARHTAAGGPQLISGAELNLRGDPLSGNGEYVFTLSNYAPVNIVGAGTQNIAFYLRSPTGNNSVSASLVFSDLIITERT